MDGQPMWELRGRVKDLALIFQKQWETTEVYQDDMSKIVL